MRLRSLALAFTLAVAGSALSQEMSRPRPTWPEAMAKGMMPYHQLTVDDFPVDNKAHPEDNFYIRTATAPQYHFILKPHQGFVYAAIDEWMVFSGLDKNETSRKSRFKAMKAALPYAQAILDINEIHARQLAALKPGELPSARGDTVDEAQTQLSAKLKEFLDAKYKETQAEMDAFAKATGNGANKKKVRQLARRDQEAPRGDAEHNGPIYGGARAGIVTTCISCADAQRITLSKRRSDSITVIPQYPKL